MNEKLIRDMMKCDGEQKHCWGCIFEDNPECRNAMARHGGALIQLQDVVIVNQGKTIKGLKQKLGEANGRIKALDEVKGRLDALLKKLAKELMGDKHCKTCTYHGEEGVEEICEKCLTQEDVSMWRLADRYFEDETDQQEPDDDEELDDDEVTEIE